MGGDEGRTAPRARLVFTFDFELGWGAIENGLWARRERAGVYRRLRPLLVRLLAHLRALEIPATWATVAGMLDPEAGDKLDHLPGPLKALTLKALEEARAGTFDGRDLAELVVDTPGQKMASHGFSHVRFQYPGVSERTVEAELQACGAVWSRHGLQVRTFVFPQNQEGYYSLLFRFGMTKARGSQDRGRKPGRVRRVWRNVVGTPPLSEAYTRDGVSLETGSLLYKVAPDQEWRLPLLEARMRRGVRAAERSGGVLHVYTHPFNLAASERLFESYTRMLEAAARLRDGGRGEILVF